MKYSALYDLNKLFNKNNIVFPIEYIFFFNYIKKVFNMKYKKLMLVTLVLLAILTIGAVSASDDVSSDNLTVSDDVDEVSVDASVDDEIISDSGDEKFAAADVEFDLGGALRS